MTSRRTFLGLLGGGAVALGGIAAGVTLREPRSASAFPEIAYGEENCDQCSMPIDDPRFACGWRTAKGDERHFDDIGCMVSAVYQTHVRLDTAMFVHDYRNESWLDGMTAAYVVSSTIKTPMGYGVAAVPTASDASLVAPGAVAQPWTQLLQTLERKA